MENWNLYVYTFAARVNQKQLHVNFRAKTEKQTMLQSRALKLGAVVKFEHIITCVKDHREPNSSINFACRMIEIACTLESNLLPTTIQTPSKFNHAIS